MKKHLKLAFWDANSPCKECTPPTRNSTCHSTCEAYLTWRAKRDKAIKTKEKKLKENNAFIDMRYERTEKTRKYQHLPK